MARRARTFLSLFVLALLGIGLVALLWLRRPHRGPTLPTTTKSDVSTGNGTNGSPRKPFDRATPRKLFVGSAACSACHVEQSRAHEKSHHARALVPPTPETVQAKLGHASFSSGLGGLTRFSERNGAYEVTTPGTDGRPQTFPVVYAAGVHPLQQYVVATERGKLQTLSVTWDTRAADEGGERWFHVYGPRGIAADDSLYFTRPAQNWNHVCADCHSTLVERRYDLAADRFDTRWAELAVGCEACHGPGAEHVRRATESSKKQAPWKDGSGLPVTLEARPPWTPASKGSPVPRKQDGVEVEVCAPCHSRRRSLHEAFFAGDPFLDAFEPELLRPGSYHADGQVEGEVYEWASFLQSRMYAAGVRCSDCHDPHSAELYATDNALCARCHAPTRFDTVSHTRHAGAKTPRCVDCHMPPAIFVQIDERRDHSIRIPRPDHSIDFGVPNACNGCHTKQTARWALEWITKWYPGSARRPHFVEALGRQRKGTLDAAPALRALAQESTAPVIARATALELLRDFPTEKTIEALRAGLASSEPLIVYGAVRGATELPLRERAALLLPVAGHGVRAVRIAVGKALAGVPLRELDTASGAKLERAFADVRQSFAVAASDPRTHIELSAFELAAGNRSEAERALRAALRLSPCLSEAHLNLADLARARSDEAAAEPEIRAALRCEPQNAAAHHALGLWQVRRGETRAAVTSLRKAVELAPGEARFAYVLAVALADGDDVVSAVEILEATLKHRPNDPTLLQAAASYRRQLGRVEAAADAERMLETLLTE